MNYRIKLLLWLFLIFTVLQTAMAAGADLPGPVLLPAAGGGPVDEPALLREAVAQPELLLLKTAVFDPVRDGTALFEELGGARLKAGQVGTEYFLLQFREPVTPALRRKLAAAGGEILDYVPNQALLMRLPPETQARLQADPAVRWLGPYLPAMKVAPELLTGLRHGRDMGPEPHCRLLVEFFPGAATAETLNLLTRYFGTDPDWGISRYHPDWAELEISWTSAEELMELLALAPAVKWLEERRPDRLFNDDTIWACQRNSYQSRATPLFQHGILGQGQIVAVADSGLDKDMCYFIHASGSGVIASQRVEPPGALTVDHGQRKLIAYNIMPSATDNDDSIHQYHGTHVAGTVAGDNLSHLATPGNPGHDTGDGMAPLAKLIMMDGGPTSNRNLYFPSPFYVLWEQERNAGARIANNSWGDDTNLYNAASASNDKFVWEHEDFLLCMAAGNGGSGIRTLNYISTSKNVLSVANTSHGSTGADSITLSSSRGPTNDGRIKPDLAAPGDQIVSAGGDQNAQNNCGTQIMGGTSMASPAVAGLAALVRQYFMDGWYPSGAANPADGLTPSAALLRSVLINSCINLTGVFTGSVAAVLEDAPNTGQGWGRPVLDNALYFADQTDDPRLLIWDVPNAQGLATGETLEYAIEVQAGKPLKIILAWTDPPALPTAAVALVNDLDLEAVAPDGTIYRGNQWGDETRNDKRESRPGPAGFDRLNNTEGILVKIPAAGRWQIRVKGVHVPGYGLSEKQGFGLSATGRIATAANAQLFIQSLAPVEATGDGDGIIEAGETIQLQVTVANSGGSASGAVNAHLQAVSGPATVQTGLSAYPDLLPGQAAVNPVPFAFQVAGDAAAGSVLNFNLVLTGSPAGTFTLPVNLTVSPVTAPGLTNFIISETGLARVGGTTYNSYINIGLQFNYADPGNDLIRLVARFRVNGQDLDITPLEMVINQSSASGTFNQASLEIWRYLATNQGETLQLTGYLEDRSGFRSATVESNVLTFTLGSNPGTPGALDDDDSVYVPFPAGFTFPFYGKVYPGCWVNSDGNISFGAGYENQDRSPASFLSQMPRIAPLLTDLVKSPGDGAIQIQSETGRFTIRWIQIAQWSATLPSGQHTFSISLYPDGQIELVYGTCTLSQTQADADGIAWKAVTGISPGNCSGAPADLSALSQPVTIPPGQPVYQAFGRDDAFDLENLTLRFIPANPPAAPAALTATAVSPGQIDLQWQDQSDNETGFRIWRKTGAEPAGADGQTADGWTATATTGPGVTSYQDKGLAPSTTYLYQVTAFNGGGDSAASNQASAKTADPVPNAPGTLTAEALTSRQVRLAWQDNSSNETGFRLERKPDGGAWAEIAILAPGTTSYTDSGLTAGTAYGYRVRAVNGNSFSGYSNEILVTTWLYDVIVPAAAHTGGVNGTAWRTDLDILNLGAADSTVELALLRASTSNLNPSATTVQASAGRSLRLTDILGSTFNASNAALGIRFAGDHIWANSRFYNMSAGCQGSFGMYIPAFAARQALKGDGNSLGILHHLSHTLDEKTGYRTNIGFANATGLETQVRIKLYGDGGELIGTTSTKLLPYAHGQFTRIHGVLNTPAVAHGHAVVEVLTAGGCVHVYAMLIDNLSGDPVYMPARVIKRTQPAGSQLPRDLLAELELTGDYAAFIPAVAHVTGANTVWRSDLDLMNPGNTAASVDLAKLNLNSNNLQPQVETVSVPAGQTVRLDDILGTLFTGGNAAIGIRPVTGSVLINSKFYNMISPCSPGTFGMYVPASGVEEAVSGDGSSRAVFHHLASSAAFRTNIGFVNASGVNVQVRIRLFDDLGVQAGQKDHLLLPYEHRQFSVIFREYTTAVINAGYATVEVLTSGGQVIPYAMLIDNRTGDPIYLLPDLYRP